MSAGHTPGPWFVVNQGTRKEPMMSVMAARISGKPSRHEVAYCGTGDSDQEMENANTRLIAAAPDLLAALKAMVEPYNGFTKHQIKRRADPAEFPRVMTAFAIIAKVEGKAP